VVCAGWLASRGGLGPGDWAAVLGIPLAVMGSAAAVDQIFKPREDTDADMARSQAHTLADRVADDEGRVLKQLLGKDTQRINLSYDLLPSPIRSARAPAAGLAQPDPAVPLPDIAAYYRGTRPARLVITGAPGAGKTVLALELLLALIKTRDEADPVPLRVSLAHWDTQTPLGDLLIEQITDAIGLGRATALNLVAHGMVLPLLDGLDEMDPPLPDGHPDPAAPRARAALAQLSDYQRAGAAAPLVLICRTAHYDALADADLLLDAARITVAPIANSSAVDYLASRAHAGARDLARWQPLLDYLIAQPTSVHAQLLSTPWRLCLTATDYHHTGDPAELLTRTTADTLDDHLLARYISAVTNSAADNSRGYTPQQIHGWLHHLAVHLATPSAATPSAAARTDIALDRLWPMAGRTLVRTVDGLLAALILFLAVPLAWYTPSPPRTCLFLGCAALIFGMLHRFVKDERETAAKRLDLHRLATPAGCVRLGAGLLVGLTAGFVGWIVLGLADGMTVEAGELVTITAAVGVVVYLGIMLVSALTGAAATAIAGDQSPASTPGAIIGEDAQLGLVVGLVVGLGAGLTSALLSGPVYGAVVGLVFGIPSGLTGESMTRASWRYMVFLLCARKKVPFRLARFLDWSCDTGLMRYAGTAYQFRHRELQQWLAAHPNPTH